MLRALSPLGIGVVLALPLAGEPYSITDAQALLKKHCLACHMDKTAAGGFDAAKLAAKDSLLQNTVLWRKALARVRDNEMPPMNAPQPKAETREHFVAFVEHQTRTAACADGIQPGAPVLKRLNRSEYSATIRDLLHVHINAGRGLPADGAGGEGFDNAAETLFLSPIHAEKYLEAARGALEYGMGDPRARSRFIVEPTEKLTPEQAARGTLDAFLPRAFRRTIAAGETDRPLRLFAAARQRGESYDNAILLALQSVLISPQFLFRIERPTVSRGIRPIDSHAMASRLSYWLWGSMPDDELLLLAAMDQLREPASLETQIVRMLKSEKSREFAESFVEQWLGTRELGRDIKPDKTLFPAYYDEEIQGAMRFEPVLFFQDVLAENRSLLTLIDSDFSFLTNKLARHYGITYPKGTQVDQQPRRLNLPEGSHRGGVMGMAAVLATTSMPTRTSPVLRGKWVLDALLGTPPPPPPPNVPALEENHAGAPPKSMRERLSKHRENPVCASCHDKIDPLGFALDNYDALGRWRTEDAGVLIDATGKLADGTAIDGVAGLKRALLDRKHLFIRNLTAKMLGYALGRGLTLEDQCAVDEIAAKLEKDNYAAQTLIKEIVLSVPFRYHPPTTAGQSTGTE